MDRAILNIRRRLERWELGHLRALAADLAKRLEAAEVRALQAEDAAEHWRDEAMELMEAAIQSEDGATHRAIGMSASGELMVVRLAS